jgi:hypothetical protein
MVAVHHADKVIHAHIPRQDWNMLGRPTMRGKRGKWKQLRTINGIRYVDLMLDISLWYRLRRCGELAYFL